MERALSGVLRAAMATIVACTAVGHAPAGAAIRPAAASCRALSASLREQLETVTEAVIDGRPAAVPVAAHRAMTWWTTYGRSLDRGPEADSLVARMSRAARGGQPQEAARDAVRLSVQSLGWCGGELGTTDRLMLVDLAGMTGWLRARGARLDWPGGAETAADSLASALVARGRGALAAQLRRSLAATLSMPEVAAGDIHAAVRLLDTVDLVEKALRPR